MSRQTLPTLISIGLAVLGVAAVAALLAPTASAQNTESCDFEQHPLFIDEVEPVPTDTSDDSFVGPDGMAFVQNGDEIAFDVTIDNRVDAGTCVNYPDGRTDSVNLSLEYIYNVDPTNPDDPDSYESTTNEISPNHQEMCNNGDLRPANTPCTVRIQLPAAPSGDRAVRGGDDGGDIGEQRVRFMTADTDSERQLAGAERVLVVDALPDLSLNEPDTEITWNSPQDAIDRSTVYGGTADTEFGVTFQNVGDYPSWNPNNGNEYVSRSSYDAPDDGDEAPENDAEPAAVTSPNDETDAATGDDYDDNGWPCHWADEGGGDNDDEPDGVLAGDEPACSYRRGKILDLPIAWTATDPDTGLAVDSGVNTEIGPSTGIDDVDKDGALLHTDHENSDADTDVTDTIQTQTISGPDRFKRAGTFDYQVRLNDESETLARDAVTPESSDDFSDNDDTRDVDIFGVDLDITDHGISVPSYPGDGLCTDPTADPCEAGARIHVDPEYVNSGDGILDADPDVSARDRTWNASVTVQIGEGGDEEIAEVDNGLVVEQLGDPIKASSENESSEKLFSQEYRISSADKGGKHILRIRLDHPLSYPGDEFPVEDPEGRIAEITEQPDCPPDWDSGGELPEANATNTYCIPLYFNDTTDPEINTQAILQSDAGEDEVPEIQEGQNATFQANVTDNSIESVEAVFEDPEGNVTLTRPMHLNHSDPDPNLWEVNQSHEGLLGDYVFTVRVQDSGGHEVTDSRTFTVVELPKEISTVAGQRDHVNDVTGPRGDDAPRYRGTADEPENVFNFTINTTGTGRDDSALGKHLVVHDDEDQPRVEVPMEDLDACRVEQAVGGPQPGYGSDCDTDENDVVGDNVWTLFYVNNTETPWAGTENISLPWTGTFNLTAKVNDTFDRLNHSNWTVEIADRVNDNDLVEPNVTEVDVGPTTLAPGESLDASAYAKDALRVERVYLDVVKPSGNETEAELDLVSPDPTEHNTGNGTYSGAFEAGVDGDVFDQAGDYEVQLVADDFGNNPNVTEIGTVTVQPGDGPSIASFFTEPPEGVEEGTRLRWVADIDSDTAIQPPTLTIEKPNGETVTEELTFNETQDRWMFETEPEAVLDASQETWSYELEVADFADQTASSAGEIEILANTAPRAIDWSPNVPGSDLPYSSPTPTIAVSLVDGNGVNQSTIEMTVDEEAVSPEIQPIAACEECFRLKYTPEEAYEGGETVTVEVRATDNSPDEQASEWQVHQFEVDATPATATIDLDPSLRGDPATIVGSTTDVNVSTNDAGAGPGELTVEVTNLAGSSPGPTESQTFEDGRASFRLQSFDRAFRGHGEYRIVAIPTDAVGNAGEQTQKRVQFDEAPPRVALEPQPGQPAAVVTVRVEDISRIDQVFATFTADEGPERRIELDRDGDLWTGRIVEPDSGEPYPENTTIEYTIQASDTWGNTGGTDPRSFLAGNTPPSVALDNPEEGDQLSGAVNVRWTATDDETPSDQLNVSLWYQRPGDEQPREVPGATDVDNVGQYQLDTTLLPNGEMELQVIAFDGATFSQDTVNVTIRNLGEAFSSVEIRGAEPEDGTPTLDPDQETTFSVQIDENVRRAWANVTRDGEVIRSYELTDAGGGSWETAFTAPSEPGSYSIDLEALTPEGRLETQSAYGFQVTGEDKSFVPEWTILSVLFAGTVAVGAFGLSRRWG